MEKKVKSISLITESSTTEQMRQAQIGAEIGVVLTTNLPIKEKLQLCTDSIVKHLDVAFARIWTLEQHNSLVLKASSGMYTHLDGPHGKVTVGQLKIGLIAKERKPHLTNKVTDDPRVSNKKWAKKEGMVAFAGYPLVVEEKLMGVIAVFAKRELSNSVLELLGSIADKIALGIDQNKMDKERTQLVMKLKSSEELFRAIIENSSDGIRLTDKNGTILYASPSTGRILGYNHTDFVDKKIFDLIHPEDKDTYVKIFEKLLSNPSESLTLQYRLKHKDGSWRWMEGIGKNLLDDESVKAIVSNFRDITERKQLENNLIFLAEASKTLSSSLDYRTTLSNIVNAAVPDIADWCSIDILVENKIEQLGIAHINPSKVKWAKALRAAKPPQLQDPSGVPLVLRTATSHFYPSLSMELLKKSVTSKKELALVKKLQLSSIMMVPICMDKKAIGVISLIFSESGRHYTKTDLLMAEELASRASLAIQNATLYQTAQENESKFKAFVESNIVGVFTTNNKGCVTDFNDGFLKIIGYGPDELKKNNFKISELTPAEYKKVDQKASQELRLKGSTIPWEKEYIKKDGSQVPVIVGTILVNKDTGEKITIVLDITERKRLEQRKDEFISIASHELKTPLTSIKGYVQILERIIQEMGNDKAKMLVVKTNTYINRLNSLIGDLLDVSKIQAGKLQFHMTEFDFCDLVKDAIDAIQATSSQHTIICQNCNHIKVFGDMHRLEQVLMNLLSNAIKYSPNANKVIINIRQEKNYLKVAVHDFGVGIAVKNHSKLFQRFYRVEKTAAQFSGLGIGLYISSEIISRHGGKIGMESQENKGSIFYFELPIKENATVLAQ